jgi:hypothetical protein
MIFQWSCMILGEVPVWIVCCRCDREDRHRGLCNHKATVPGPAAHCEAAKKDIQLLSMAEDAAADADDISLDGMGSSEQDSAGHHSHNQKTLDSMDDDREVASALKSGECWRINSTYSFFGAAL